MREREKLEKECLNCTKKIAKSKIYCDNKCQVDYQNKVKYEKLASGDLKKLGGKDTIDRVSKRYLIKLHGNKCMKCDWCEINKFTKRVPIELNHIDGNPENNEISNLELLCPNCHSLTEYHKSRGKGRKWRKTIILSTPL